MRSCFFIKLVKNNKKQILQSVFLVTIYIKEVQV